jgi:hypothetical protein
VRLCPADRLSLIPPGLDLHPDPDEEFTAGKVRSGLERLYASAGMGLIRVGKEVQRIGSWEDPTRSVIALTVSAVSSEHSQTFARIVLNF